MGGGFRDGLGGIFSGVRNKTKQKHNRPQQFSSSATIRNVLQQNATAQPPPGSQNPVVEHKEIVERDGWVWQSAPLC
jgi:hypothetical protein